jgi:hypothetical protein
MTDRRVFLLSPAWCGGERAQLLFNESATFPLAERVRSEQATLGEIFSFLSGLYFRGKLAYAEAFGRPPRDVSSAIVITPCEGLRPAREIVNLARLRRFAEVPVALENSAYLDPLARDLAALKSAIGAQCSIVLLGSIASAKYVDPAIAVFGKRLLFPIDFVGRGDMSRGGLLLRSVAESRELAYAAVAESVRRGPRPARLDPKTRPKPRTAESPPPIEHRDASTTSESPGAHAGEFVRDTSLSPPVRDRRS